MIKNNCSNIELYVLPVFFLDDCGGIMLNTVKVVVNFEALLMNISRVILQQTRILRVIKKQFIQRCLEMFVELSEKNDEHNKFCQQFGNCSKSGVREDSMDRQKIAKLLRLNMSKSGDEQICFKVYIDGTMVSFMYDCDELMPDELMMSKGRVES